VGQERFEVVVGELALAGGTGTREDTNFTMEKVECFSSI
jgi:hypothetical protein